MGFRDFMTNTFFDAFKGIDQIVHADEFRDIGSAGEQFTYRALWYYFEDRLFRNVYLRDEKGELTEIDLLGVSKKGIYVFESKNYSGSIYGDGKRRDWLYYLGRKKYKFYSPILQNERHISVLKHVFKDLNPPMFSVIIFSARCSLKLKNIPDSVVIVKRDGKDERELNKKMLALAEKHSEVLSDEQVDQMCDILRQSQRPDNMTKEEHLSRLEKFRH